MRRRRELPEPQRWVGLQVEPRPLGRGWSVLLPEQAVFARLAFELVPTLAGENPYRNKRKLKQRQWRQGPKERVPNQIWMPRPALIGAAEVRRDWDLEAEEWLLEEQEEDPAVAGERGGAAEADELAAERRLDTPQD